MPQPKIDFAVGVTGADRAKAALRDIGNEAETAARKAAAASLGPGFFDSLAAGARNARREDRQSGETALSSFLNRSGGVADLGASALGLGATSAVIGFGADQIKSMAEQASKLKVELREGNISTGEMADKFAGSLPFGLGQSWQAGRALHEALTGSKDEISLINAEAKITTALFEAQAERAVKIKAIFEDIAAARRKLQATTAETLAVDPYKAARISAQETLETQLDANKKDRKAALDDESKARQKEIDQQKALVDNLRAQFQSKFGSLDDYRPSTRDAFRANQLNNDPDLMGKRREGEADWDTISAAERRLRQLGASAVAEREQIRSGFAGLDVDAQANYLANVEKAMRDRRDLEIKAADEIIEHRKAKEKEADDTIEHRLEERRRTEIREMDERIAKAKELRELQSDAAVKALEFQGRAGDAAKLRITAAALEKMRGTSSADEQRAILLSAGYDLYAAQAAANTVQYSGRAAPATSFAQRFQSGYGDQVLGQTSKADQIARNSQKLVEIMTDVVSLFKQIVGPNGIRFDLPTATDLNIGGNAPNY